MVTAGSTFEVAMARAGHLDVAFPALRIGAVLKNQPADIDIPRLSLAACLGVAVLGATAPQTHLQIVDERGGFELGVDGQVTVRAVELSRLHRLPHLVRGVGERMGISGLLELAQGLIYFIDLDALNQWIVRKEG